MQAQITVEGLIATTPRHVTTAEGVPTLTFRLAQSNRRFDAAAQQWVDASTNWYTISCERVLANNAFASLSKGDRVIVTGSLRIRDWENDDRTGTTVEILARTLGHDLFFGTATYERIAVMPND